MFKINKSKATVRRVSEAGQQVNQVEPVYIISQEILDRWSVPTEIEIMRLNEEEIENLKETLDNYCSDPLWRY